MAECTLQARGGSDQATSEAETLGLVQHSLASSSVTVLPQPTAALSFPEQTQMAEEDPTRSPARGSVPDGDVCMSPEQDSRPDWCCPESPAQASRLDWDVPMSPAQAPAYNQHVPVSSAPPAPAPAGTICFLGFVNLVTSIVSTSVRVRRKTILVFCPAVGLVSDPWDEDLISRLLSRLPTPLSSYPGFVSWDHKLPNISPKITLSIGEELKPF